MKTKSKFRIAPSIRVHVWGGFGSQLFALIIAKRLQVKSQLRRVKIIFHTSGVTKRNLEMPDIWLEKFEVETRADFRNKSPNREIEDRNFIISNIRNKLKNLFLMLGLTATSNTEIEFSGLKPWVVSIRGHYTQINLTESEIQDLMDKFDLSADTPPLNEVAIHYRLGDLLKLDSKGFIRPQRIFDTWKSRMNTDLPLHFFSDSTMDDFQKVWREVGCPKDLEFSNLSPIRTIQSCFNAKEFLGTNAKLSLWIAILRSGSISKTTFMPKETEHQINALLNKNNLGKTLYQF